MARRGEGQDRDARGGAASDQANLPCRDLVGPVTIRLEEGASALDHQFAQLREEPPHRLA